MDDEAQRISRRDALRKAAFVGAVAWTVPAVQTINMASARAQTSPNTICSKFRIDPSATLTYPHCGTVGGSSCLPANSDQQSCAPLRATSPVTANTGAEWVICLDAGCEIEGVGLKASTNCFYSTQNPSDPSMGVPVSSSAATWSGWYVDSSNCLHVPRMVRTRNGNPIDNSHVDVIACCPAT